LAFLVPHAINVNKLEEIRRGDNLGAVVEKHSKRS